MYLKKSLRAKGIYLSIAEGYHDPQRGWTRTRTIQKIGYADDYRNE
jgi:hypothetical protein